MTVDVRQYQKRTRLLALVALLPTILVVILATVGPITSGDLWWHLRTGEWILEHGKLPAIDPFSHTAGDTPWILQEYGSQVAFALVHRLGGFGGLKLLASLVSMAILATVFLRSRSSLRLLWAVAMTATFALLFALKWELRPHLFSLLFFFWLERCLFPRHKTADTTPNFKRCLELAMLSMVWVQLHAEALFTPLLTAAVCTGAIVATLREKLPARHAYMWLAMAASALVGTLASPLFAKPHIYALVGRGAPQKYIEEWFRPWVLPGDPRFAPVTLAIFICFAAALVAGLVFAAIQLRQRLAKSEADTLDKHLSWERLAFLVGCLIFALSARRFFWLTWFPLLDCVMYLGRTRPRLKSARALPAAAALIAATALFGTHYPASTRASIERGQSAATVDSSLFPRFAAEFARDAGLTGNLYHPYEWGGYIGFITGQPVFIDGRTVLFEEVIQERWLAEHDPVQRKQIFDARKVGLVIFDHLVETPDGPRPWNPGPEKWLRVWTDVRADVWVRRGSANQKQATAWWLAHQVVLDPKAGITVADVYLAQPDWLPERQLLPGELAQQLRAAAPPAKQFSPTLLLARLRFWQSLGMRKNIRAELRAVLRLGDNLYMSGYSTEGATQKIQDRFAQLLKNDDLDGFIEAVQLNISMGGSN